MAMNQIDKALADFDQALALNRYDDRARAGARPRPLM